MAHAAVQEIAGNRRLKQSLAEHRAILKALERRDPDAAAWAMHDHLLSGRAAVAKLQSA